MLHMPRIPELAQRDRFVRRAISEGRVLTLADEENATVPSQKAAGRAVQLFWSSPVEAGRWAEALAGNDELQDITLATFAADILPGIARAKGLVGTDWVSDPIEAEIDARDLQFRLKREAIAGYVNTARTNGEVFLICDEEGPLLSPSEPKATSGDVLLVFMNRADAERHMKLIGAKRIITDPIVSFIASTLSWAGVRTNAVAIEPIPGAGFIELKIDEMSQRLAAASPA